MNTQSNLDKIIEEFNNAVNFALEIDKETEYVFLFKKKDTCEFGLLYVENYTENLDIHCDQCMNEFLCFRFRLVDDVMYFTAVCSHPKFQKILHGLHEEFNKNFELVGNFLLEREECYKVVKKVINEKYKDKESFKG